MKNRVLKSVCGVMLSAMLVITMAIPVLAACEKNKHTIIDGDVSITYPHVSESNHEKKTVIKGKCSICGDNVETIAISTKPHTPDKSGKCTECGYQM